MLALGLFLSVWVGVSLGFFGGGGSILTVPLLVYVFGLEPKVAIATSLLVVALASLSGALQHARAGNVDVRTGAIFGAAGMVGAYGGGRAGAYLDGALLMLLFAATMLLAASAMWRGRREPDRERESNPSTPKLLLQGFAVGSFTGLVGAGGGFLIVPALALWAGLAMPVAVGTSLVVIVLNTSAGFAGYASHVPVSFFLVACVATAAVAGSFIGSAFARRVDPSSLRRSFAAFVLVMGATILVREASLWVVSAQAALPTSMPQLVFALVMLAVGVLTGRASRPMPKPAPAPSFSSGAGI